MGIGHSSRITRETTSLESLSNEDDSEDWVNTEKYYVTSFSEMNYDDVMKMLTSLRILHP